MAKTPSSQYKESVFDPWSGNQIPHAVTKTQQSYMHAYIYTHILKENEQVH